MIRKSDLHIFKQILLEVSEVWNYFKVKGKINLFLTLYDLKDFIWYFAKSIMIFC